MRVHYGLTSIIPRYCPCKETKVLTMENNLFKNIIFNHLFGLKSKENNLLTTKERGQIEYILKTNPYFIELVPPEIKVSSGISLPLKSKLFYIKEIFASETDFYLNQLKIKHNPLFFSSSSENAIYRPFCFVNENYAFVNRYLLYSDVSISNDIYLMKGKPIINFQIGEGNFQLNEFSDKIELFVLPNENTLVVLNMINQIPRITDGIHVMDNNLLDFKYSINGCYLNYSAIKETVNKASACVQFGVYDIYNSKIIFCKHTTKEFPDELRNSI